MVEYMDLVLCRKNGFEMPVIFRAPAWSYLEKGDTVIVDWGDGGTEAVVEKSYTVSAKDKDEIDFIMTASGTKLPLRKVLKIIKCIDFEYKEDEDNE